MLEEFNKMFRFGIVFFLANVIEKSITFLLLPLHTKYLSPEEYGVLGIMLIAVTWTIKFVAAPIGNGITREYHSLPKDRVGRALFTSYLFGLAQLILVGIFIFPNSHLVSNLLFETEVHSELVQFFVLLIVTQPMYELFASLLRVKGMSKKYLYISSTTSILSAITQWVLFVYYDMGIYAVGIGLGVSYGINAFAMGFVGLKEIQFQLDFPLLKKVLHFGYPLLMSAVITTSLTFVERYIVRDFQGEAVLGVYLFGFRIAAILNILVGAPLKQAFIPIVFKMENDKEKQLKFVRETCHVFLAGAMILWLGLSIYSREVVQIAASQESYYGAVAVIPVIGFGNVIFSMMSYFGLGMNMARKSFQISMTSFYRFVVAVLLLYFLTKEFGAFGAAVAGTIAVLVLMFTRALYSYKYFDVTFDWSKILGILVLGLLMFASSEFLVSRYLDGYLYFGARLILVAVYAMCLWFVVLNVDDRRLILNLKGILSRRSLS